MKKSHILLSLTALLIGMQVAGAQSLFDLPMFPRQSARQAQTNNIKFDYNVDFNYFFDVRQFGASNDIFVLSEVLNVARLTPTVGLTLQQNKNYTHRIMAGIDVMKDLGENPVAVTYYSDDEDRLALMNSYLLKELLLYYNFRATQERSLTEIYAGVFPRRYRSGYYSRSMFSDADMIYNPNIEGLLFKFENRRFIAEAGADCLGFKAIDRRLAYMGFTSGLYRPFKWGSIGWDGTYTIVGQSYIIPSSAQSLIFNPYLQFDFGDMLKMQELSIKAGGLMSYQILNDTETTEKMPMAVELVSTVKNWNFGIENTFYFGDNMMPFRSSNYTSTNWTSSASGALYKGERLYYTRRGYASIYDRLEMYYQPSIAPFLDMKISAVGHFINASEAIGSFLGWQAKASLIFNLEALRNPARHVFGNINNKKSKTTPKQNGPAIKL